MTKLMKGFNKLPGWFKVLLYAGITQALGILLSNINNASPVDVRALLGVGIGIILNIVGYLAMQEKGGQG